MSAAGGRRLPVIVDLILQGNRQVEAGLQNVLRSYQQLTQQIASAIGPMNRLEQTMTGNTRQMNLFGGVASRTGTAMANTARQTTLLDAGFKRLEQTNLGAARAFMASSNAMATAQRQLTLFETGTMTLNTRLVQTQQSMATFSAALLPIGTQAQQAATGLQRLGAVSGTVGSGLERTATATENATRRMSPFRAAIGAAREEARGLAFASIGMFGAINEAAFMIENASQSTERLAEAKAEVTRLEQEGAEGTQEYTRAVQEMERAQRAANFTNRIMTQSVFDIISFTALAATQVGGLVSSYRKHRGAVIQSAAANVELMTSNGALAGSQVAVATSSRATEAALALAGTTAISTSGRLSAVSGSLRNTGLGFGDATKKTSEFTTKLKDLALGILGIGGGLTGLRARLGDTDAQISKMGTSAANSGKGLGALEFAAGAATGMLGGKLVPALKLAGIAGAVAAGAFFAFGGILQAFESNFGGFRDIMYGVVNAFAEFGEKVLWVVGLGDMFGGVFRDVGQKFLLYLSQMNDGWEQMVNGFAEFLGFEAPFNTMAEQQEEVAKTSELIKEKLDEMNSELQVSINTIEGYGQSWETVFKSADGFISDIAGSFRQFNSGVEGEIAALQKIMADAFKIDPGGEVYKSANMRLTQLINFEQGVKSTFDKITMVLNDAGSTWGNKWAAITNELGKMPDQLLHLPQQFKAVADQFVSVMDRAFENDKISPEQWGQIYTDMIDGEIEPANRRLIASLEGGQAALDQWDLTMANVDTNSTEFKQTINGMSQQLGFAGMTIEYVSDQFGLLEIAVDNAEAAQQRIAASHKFVADALTGLNEESLINQRNNERIVEGARHMGQAFDEAAVGMAAQASGLQTWRDELAQAYFNIVETATALGYFGSTSKTAAADMLQFTANQERQNEINAQSVESYFQLTQAMQEQLAVMNITDEVMGQVALGYQDLTQDQADAIAILTQLGSAQERNVEGAAQLMAAGKSLSEVMAMSNDEIAKQLTLLEQQEEGYIASAETAKEWLDAILELPPALQAVFESLGLLNIEGQKLEPWMTRTKDYLAEVGQEYMNTEDEARKFAIAQGVNVVDAMKATGPALADMIIGLTDLTNTQLNAAEAAQESAQKFADAWMQSFENIKSMQSDWASTMGSAMDKMSKEFGEEMEVGLSDIEKKVAKGSQGFFKQFAEEIFPEDFLATALIEGNDPQDIIKELKDLKKDVVKEELITSAEAKEMFDPMLNFMKHELPHDTDQAMGYLVGRMPHIFKQMEPVIVNGVKVAGGAARGALDTNLVQPFIEGLKGLETGASGVEFGRSLIEDVDALMPYLESQFPQMAGLFQQTMDNASLTTDQKVQEIIGYLGQIDPAFAAMIMAIDQDADNIPDIIDESILGPMEQMQIGILSGMQAYHSAIAQVERSLGNIAAANYHQAIADNIGTAVDNIITGSEQASTGVEELVANMEAFNTRTGETVGLGAETVKIWNAMDPAARELSIAAYEAFTGIDVLGHGLSEAEIHAENAERNMDSFSSTVEDIDVSALNTQLNDLQTRLSTIATSSATATDKMLGFREVVQGAGQIQRTARTAGDRDTELDAMETGEDAEKAWEDEKNRTGTTTAIEQPAELDPGVMIDPYLEKLQELSDSAREIIPKIEIAWTSHLANTTAQIQNFITGGLAPLATEYVALQTYVPPILASMELAWTNHLANNGAQINAFIVGPLTTLAQAYMLYQTNVVPILQAMELAWTMHITNNTGQILAFINTLWGLQQTYITMQWLTGVIGSIELAWTMHITNTTAQIAAFIVGPLLGLINTYPLIAQAAHTNLENMNVNWAAHVTHVQSVVTSLISGGISGYISTMAGLAIQVHASLESANQFWAAHQEHVGGMAEEIASHVDQLASDIEDAMGRIVDAMGQAETAAVNLKSAIDALESKEITITTNYVTTGSPGGGPRQHGFTGIISQPTTFLVGEHGMPEYVSVTPLVGRNVHGDPSVQNFFSNVVKHEAGSEDHGGLKMAGEGGMGTAHSLGPANSGLKRPDIRPASERRERGLNAFYEDVLTYTEEQEYKKLLKKLKKKKWKPSKLSDENEEKLYQLEDKILKAREQQMEQIKSAMEQVIPQINLSTDLSSDEELEKWVTTVVPPLSSAPLSMHASAVKAMSIRGRYQHHRDAMKTGRREQLTWLDQEYDRQQKLLEEAEEKRQKAEEEKEDWLLEHGSKKQKKKIEKLRKKRAEEQRRKLYLGRSERRDFAYYWAAERYYGELAKQVAPPVKIPLPPDSTGIEKLDPSVIQDEDINAKRGFSGIVRNRTNITAGEFGRAERVDITPIGEETKNIAKEVREEIRHFITGNLNGLGGGGHGGRGDNNKQVIVVHNNQPIEVKLNEQVLVNAVNKSLMKVIAGKR